MSDELNASNMTQPRPDHLTRRDILTAGTAPRTLFLAAALAPMVFVYNVCAFDQVDTAGSRTLYCPHLSSPAYACRCC